MSNKIDKKLEKLQETLDGVGSEVNDVKKKHEEVIETTNEMIIMLRADRECYNRLSNQVDIIKKRTDMQRYHNIFFYIMLLILSVFIIGLIPNSV